MGFKGASGKFGHVRTTVTTWVSPSSLFPPLTPGLLLLELTVVA